MATIPTKICPYVVASVIGLQSGLSKLRCCPKGYGVYQLPLIDLWVRGAILCNF